MAAPSARQDTVRGAIGAKDAALAVVAKVAFWIPPNVALRMVLNDGDCWFIPRVGAEQYRFF